jgi:hypothetical protein
MAVKHVLLLQRQRDQVNIRLKKVEVNEQFKIVHRLELGEL